MGSVMKMYAIMCAAASDAVDLLRQRKYRQAELELLAALERAEEIYLNLDAQAQEKENSP